MDEVEAGKYIQAHWHIPVVYMTAYPEEGAWHTRHPTSVRWADELLGSRLGGLEADLSSDERDGAAYGPWPWSSIRPLRGRMTGRRAPRGTRPSFTRCTTKRVPQLHPEVPERLPCCWQVTR